MFLFPLMLIFQSILPCTEFSNLSFWQLTGDTAKKEQKLQAMAVGKQKMKSKESIFF